jgi:O-acetylhomoserine (thiol)-lyase
VLDYLKSEDAVSWVLHPDLPDHPDHALGQKLMPKGCGSIVSFGVKGGRRAGATFIEACRLASHLANVGDAKTLVIHPASTTHQQMSAEELKRAGVGEDMVRLSVGLEDPDDIIADLRQALRASQKSGASQKD